MSQRFGQRLAARIAERGPLCVGIDPHPELLAAWDLPNDTNGLERFALSAVEAIADKVAVLKPQSAFFEAHGSAGIAVLERTMRLARQAGALVLLDVKRGDIGSTMTAYGTAYLGPDGPLVADAITVSPYLGFGSLAPVCARAQEHGQGVIVLARTSNPDSNDLQNAVMASGKTVAQAIVDDVASVNSCVEPVGDIGVVVGATVDADELSLAELNGPILAPGFGAQGATTEDLLRLFGPDLRWVLPASAREILQHGPSASALAAAVNRTRAAVAELVD